MEKGKKQAVIASLPSRAKGKYTHETHVYGLQSTS